MASDANGPSWHPPLNGSGNDSEAATPPLPPPPAPAPPAPANAPEPPAATPPPAPAPAPAAPAPAAPASAPTPSPTPAPAPAAAPYGAEQWTSAPDGTLVQAPNGAATPAAAGPMAYGAPGEPRQPMSPKSKRALIATLVSVGVVGLLIGGAAITFGVLNAQRDPANTVEEYLTHIANGDAEAATEMVDHGRKNATAVLLTNEVLGSAVERIEVVKVETVDRAGDTAYVEATMKLDGEKFTEYFEVKKGPKEWLFLDTWELNDPLLGELEIGADYGIAAVSVNGVELELSDDSGGVEQTFYLYPGIYEVGGAEGKYFTSSTEEVTMMGADGDYAWVWLTEEPTPAFEAFVTEKVEERIKACVTVPTNMDFECPYFVQKTNLAVMEYTETFPGFYYLERDYFETDWFSIGVRTNSDKPEDPLDIRDFYAGGDIEWKDGEPTLKNIYIY